MVARSAGRLRSLAATPRRFRCVPSRDRLIIQVPLFGRRRALTTHPPVEYRSASRCAGVKEIPAMTRRPVSITLLALVLAGSASLWLRAQTPTREIDISQIPIDADDIAGVVTSARGPEAGVWVIAETDELPTKFRKIVVTDDQGRYLLPDLPGDAPRTDLGARLRPRRFARGPRDTGRGVSRCTRCVAPDRARGRADLSRELLVLADRDPAGEGLSGHGPSGNGIEPRHGDAASLDQPDQERTATSATSSATWRRARFRAALGTFASTVRRPGITACRSGRTARR